MTYPSLLEIQQRYPKPARSIGPLSKGSYCVGGALCLTVDPSAGHFPCVANLARALQTLNPALPDHLAVRYADIIISWNDQGKFGRAWAYAAEALGYRA